MGHRPTRNLAAASPRYPPAGAHAYPIGYARELDDRALIVEAEIGPAPEAKA